MLDRLRRRPRSAHACFCWPGSLAGRMLSDLAANVIVSDRQSAPLARMDLSRERILSTHPEFIQRHPTSTALCVRVSLS
jgi:hypothetical protein